MCLCACHSSNAAAIGVREWGIGEGGGREEEEEEVKGNMPTAAEEEEEEEEGRGGGNAISSNEEWGGLLFPPHPVVVVVCNRAAAERLERGSACNLCHCALFPCANEQSIVGRGGLGERCCSPDRALSLLSAFPSFSRILRERAGEVLMVFPPPCLFLCSEIR